MGTLSLRKILGLKTTGKELSWSSDNFFKIKRVAISFTRVLYMVEPEKNKSTMRRRKTWCACVVCVYVCAHAVCMRVCM